MIFGLDLAYFLCLANAHRSSLAWLSSSLPKLARASALNREHPAVTGVVLRPRAHPTGRDRYAFHDKVIKVHDSRC